MTTTPAGTVTLVGGGPGAWDLITLRGARALADADVILADHLGPGDEIDRILAEINAPAKHREIIDVAKLPYGRQVAQEETNRLLVEHARAGKTVVRLKGGDPYVFGRGFEELRHCAAGGVECRVVPGVTSAVSVPAAAGVPVTHRGVVHSFTVVSGHVAPGDERSLVDWAALARVGGTIVVIMGVRHARVIAQTLVDAGLDPETPAIAVQEGTLAGQVSVRATAATLADEMERIGVSNPAVYVFGEVAALAGGGPGGA